MPAARHVHRSDAPIKRDDQDILGRGPFVQELAHFVTGWASTGARETSYVLALCGAWGSGKTSILNLLRQRLERTPSAPDVLVFSPWQFTDGNALAAAFFRDLSNAVGKRDDEKHYKEAAEKWKAYAAVLGVPTSVAPALGRAALAWTALAAASLVMSLDAVMDVLQITPAVRLIGAVAVSIGLAVAAAFTGISTQIAAFYTARSTLAKRTLDELRGEICDEMREIGRPLIVALDDLDRLEPEELRLILQLVRSNSDVPNLIFLLLLDRDRARQILERGHSSEEATGLLDKVVQTQLDVPAVPQGTIDSYLETALLDASVLGRPWTLLAEAQDPEHDLSHSIKAAVSHYVSDLRGVTRLLNAVSFQAARLRHDGVLTVYPADILLAETIRLFEPVVYSRLFESQSFLLERAVLLSAQKEERTKKVKALVVGAANPDAATAALSLLFDSVVDALGHGYRFGPDRRDWQSAGRLQHSAHFNRYASTHTPDHALSLDGTAELSSAVLEGNPVGALLESHRKDGRIVSALDVVSGAALKAPPHSVPSLLEGVLPLLEAATSIQGGGGFFRDAGWIGACTRIAERALGRLSASGDRLETLQNLASKYPFATGYLSTIPNHIVTSKDHSAGHRPRLLDRVESEALRRTVGQVSRDLLRTMTTEQVYEHARPIELYFRWLNDLDAEEARGWFRAGINAKDPRRSAALLSGFVLRYDIETVPPQQPRFELEAIHKASVGKRGFKNSTESHAAIRRASMRALTRTDLADWAERIHIAALSTFAAPATPAAPAVQGP